MTADTDIITVTFTSYADPERRSTLSLRCTEEDVPDMDLVLTQQEGSLLADAIQLVSLTHSED